MQYPTIPATVVTNANAWRAAESRHVPSGKENAVRTVRLSHFRAALLAAAGGLLAAVGLVVLYAQPAEANYPGKPGKIAYTGYDGNDPEIYTIKTAGGGRLQLTDNGKANDQPAYSPGGKRIAYAGYDGRDYEIYTIKPNGGGKLRVTDNSTANYSPYWGPR
jgi:hypothetical protein